MSHAVSRDACAVDTIALWRARIWALRHGLVELRMVKLCSALSGYNGYPSRVTSGMWIHHDVFASQDVIHVQRCAGSCGGQD
ncbi:unnamed protein product [Chondrus crispus]|uniref:Uncharacterized protein n=1 Tax=Chondrus crispus TaxID=2769 RepID=R7QH24_CHOCR|nr:unnamed protein product [Chondrus crispus]CDF37379.1 unnamed protein product [Chondrus crispus]|eukprot:XP_005717198.1 unnamed protein product [Chondrus crispus]